MLYSLKGIDYCKKSLNDTIELTFLQFAGNALFKQLYSSKNMDSNLISIFKFYAQFYLITLTLPTTDFF